MCICNTGTVEYPPASGRNPDRVVGMCGVYSEYISLRRWSSLYCVKVGYIYILHFIIIIYYSMVYN